jgi:hypothetical protein
MISDRDAQGAENITHDEQGQVNRGDETAPEAKNGIDSTKERDPDNELEDHFVGQGDWLI